MELEQKIKTYLKLVLKPEKYRHTLGVTAMAVELAKRYGVSVEKARLAGLLHDCGKELGKNKKYLRFMKLDKKERNIKALWHNALGVVLAQKIFGVKNKEVLSAVRKHTLADKNMSSLDKIIYIADSAERYRNFKGVEHIRKAAKKSLNAGFLASLHRKIEFVLIKGQRLHPRSVEAWNQAEKTSTKI